MYADRIVSGGKRSSKDDLGLTSLTTGSKRQRQNDDKWKRDLYHNDEEPQASMFMPPEEPGGSEMKGHIHLYQSANSSSARGSYNLRDRNGKKDDIANESDKRKREPQQFPRRGKPLKKMQKEDAEEGSISEDPKKTMLGRTRSSTESCTFPNFKQEQEMNQKKGVEKQTNVVLETKKRSMEESYAEDQQYKTPCREVSHVHQSVCPSQGTEMETLSNILDVPPLSMWSAESSPASLNYSVTNHNLVAYQSNFAITPRETSLDVQVQEGALHATTDVIASLSRSLSDGAHGDSSKTQVQIFQVGSNVIEQPQDTTSLDGDESNKHKKGVEHNHVEGILEDCNLLSVGSRHLWETPATVEVFRSMPQRPHFRPLAEMNECLREGYAIGYVVSFVSMVEKVRKFKFDDPNSDFVEIQSALQKFEAVGFDVESIRIRLGKLLSIKTATNQLDAKLKQVEAEIIKEKQEEDSLKSMVDDINDKIKELQKTSIELKEKREELAMKRLAKDSNITALQKSIQETEVEIQCINLHFTCIAGSPW